MNKAVLGLISSLDYGQAQEFENLAVVPLSAPGVQSPRYLTMEQAMASESLLITEINGGTVPELKVRNASAIPVLLIDGEELVGAKQNRVLNTTVLLKENQETVIPVSCTEQGRWSFVSEKFDDSGVVMAARIRGEHKASVTCSLRQSGRFSSDQGKVWQRIHNLAREAQVDAPTMAMKDVFERKSADIEDYVRAFPLLPGQQGIAAFVDGRFVGCDLVSLPAAYETLHPKLIKSFAVEAVISRRKDKSKEVNWVEKARQSIEAAQNAEEERHRSVGYGIDFRYESSNLVGSALVHEDCPIHTAFFRKESDDAGNPMASFKQRRRFRTS